MNVTVVGGGRVGSCLTAMLLKDGHNVKVVEVRAKHLQSLRDDIPRDVIIAGNFTDPAVLRKAGIEKADVVVAATPTDETNLVVATLAKFEFGVKRVIARANNPKNTWMYTPRMGVDVGLTEAELIAHALAEEMSLGDMMTLLKLQRGQFSLVQEKVHPDSAAAGTALKELNLPSNCVLVAVIRNAELLVPEKDTVIEAEDEVIAIVHELQLKGFARIMGPV